MTPHPTRRRQRSGGENGQFVDWDAVAEDRSRVCFVVLPATGLPDGETLRQSAVPRPEVAKFGYSWLDGGRNLQRRSVPRRQSGKYEEFTMSLPTNLRLGAAVAAMGVFATTAALAVVPTDWTGATIGVTYLYPNTGNVLEDDGVVMVGAGVEGDFFTGYFSYDISGNQILLNGFTAEGSWLADLFNGPHFSDSGLDDLNLTGVSINPASNMAGLSGANLTWDADNIYVNWQGLSFFPGTQVVLDLQFGEIQSEVPEASTYAAGGALAAVVGGMWLRRRRA